MIVRENSGFSVDASVRRITSSGPPSRPMTKGNVGMRRDAATGRHAVNGHAAGGDATGDCYGSRNKPPSHDTSRRQRPNSWPGWARSFRRVPGVWWRHPTHRRRPAGAGLLRTGGSQAGEGQDGFARVKSAPDTSRRTARTTARLSRPWPTDRLGRARAGPQRMRRDSDVARRTTRDRHPQPLTAFHATVPTAREKSGFKAGSSRRDKSGLERRQEAPRHLHDRAVSSPIGSGCCFS